MNHNDATDRDLPVDPDATEAVAIDLEQLLHMELDAQRSAKTVPLMKAAHPRTSTRIPLSKSGIPRMPIHTMPMLPPPAPDEDEDATCVFDRASAKLSTPSLKTPSLKSVTFPAAKFTPPRHPQPFATIPSMPVAKRRADASQGITPIQPVLAPTSRRDLRIPSANESLAPMAMPSNFPSYPPPASAGRGATFAAVLTLTFAIASMLVIGVAIVRPNALERGKVAIASAMRAKQGKAGHVSAPAAAAAPPPATTIAVPPVLIDDEPEVTIGDDQAYVIFPMSAKGHRVFIDARPLDGDVPTLTDCGKHKVQIGSSGKEKLLELPCGGGLRLE